MENNCTIQFSWIVTDQEPLLLRSYLTYKEFSKRMITRIKYRGGLLLVNGEEVTVRKELTPGDHVRVVLPEEQNNERLTPSKGELDILYEDEHYLIVNKPAGVAAVPSPAHREETMANRVKGYILRTSGLKTTVHVVTRLDRETSGAMIVAKHSFAHAQLDKQLRKKEIHKEYLAIVEGKMKEQEHQWIEEPIARSEESIITRRVHPEGKKALTEYWVQEVSADNTLVKVRLHTGRTHQIRVHFAYLGFPLLGDTLYGGTASEAMNRQALHCSMVSFLHPFTNKEVTIEAPMPLDLNRWLKNSRLQFAR